MSASFWKLLEEYIETVNEQEDGYTRFWTTGNKKKGTPEFLILIATGENKERLAELAEVEKKWYPDTTPTR